MASPSIPSTNVYQSPMPSDACLGYALNGCDHTILIELDIGIIPFLDFLDFLFLVDCRFKSSERWDVFVGAVVVEVFSI